MNLRANTSLGPHSDQDVPRVVVVGANQSLLSALETILRASGWLSEPASDVEAATAIMVASHGPRLMLIAGEDGRASADAIRDIRANGATARPYVIALAAFAASEPLAEILDAGADDHVMMPVAAAELQSRVRVGFRALEVQRALELRTRELQVAMAQVKQLQSLLPICSYCRRIRDDEHHWQHLDEYLSHHTHVRFTHGFCPQCYEQHVQPTLAAS